MTIKENYYRTYVEVLSLGFKLVKLITKYYDWISNFTMGTISWQGFAQAQVHANQSTSAVT